MGLGHRRSRHRRRGWDASRCRPTRECYTLRRVWLDEADINGYYHGFANSALWPLCHMLIQHFEFRTEYWERYRTVNLRFAHAVADEAERCTGRAMAWIQDYHFALAPEFLRAMQPSLFIHQFWHIPFPPADILRLLPIGIARSGPPRDARERSRSSSRSTATPRTFSIAWSKFVPEAHVDRARQTVAFRNRVVSVGAFPISIDVEHFVNDGVVAGRARHASTTLRDRYAQRRPTARASASTASTTRREFPSGFARSIRSGRSRPSFASGSRLFSSALRRAPICRRTTRSSAT